MKIGLVSDTHGDRQAWRDALAGPFEGAAYVLHAGDLLYHGPRNPMPAGYDPAGLAADLNEAPCPLVIARGNCDSDVDQLAVEWPIQAPYGLLALPAITILVTHGDKLTEEEMVHLGSRYQAALVVHGHTHLPSIRDCGEVMLVNPGSPALPKAAAGARPRRTVAVIEDAHLAIVDLDDGSVVARDGLPWRPARP